MNIIEAAKMAKEASITNAGMDKDIKNKALLLIKEKLIENSERIFIANEADINRSRKEDLAAPLLKRLKFDKAKLKAVTDGIDILIKLEDPEAQVTPTGPEGGQLLCVIEPLFKEQFTS